MIIIIIIIIMIGPKTNEKKLRSQSRIAIMIIIRNEMNEWMEFRLKRIQKNFLNSCNCYISQEMNGQEFVHPLEFRFDSIFDYFFIFVVVVVVVKEQSWNKKIIISNVCFKW